ncbi:hypothetical protein F2Q70_00020380 [Brassica cretica]|uniref:Uncharacterized protein n=1 Tax=Brassica cretica TaxID=69181 RepID=A0A8S9GNL0_BRACR|nr:hypothetical protein F2Q70_00020380 [Brassica cretica]
MSILRRSSNDNSDRDETRAGSIQSRRRELRGRDEGRLADPMASWTARSVQLAERVSWMVRSVQLARSASWMVPSVQLARSASWTVHSVWMIGPYSCFVVRDRLSEAWSKLSRRLIV